MASYPQRLARQRQQVTGENYAAALRVVRLCGKTKQITGFEWDHNTPLEERFINTVRYDYAMILEQVDERWQLDTYSDQLLYRPANYADIEDDGEVYEQATVFVAFSDSEHLTSAEELADDAYTLEGTMDDARFAAILGMEGVNFPEGDPPFGVRHKDRYGLDGVLITFSDGDKKKRKKLNAVMNWAVKSSE